MEEDKKTEEPRFTEAVSSFKEIYLKKLRKLDANDPGCKEITSFLNNIKNREEHEKIALIAAIERNNLKFLVWLADNQKIEIIKYSKLLVHSAISNQYLEILKWLIDKKNCCLTSKQLMLAESCQNPKIRHYLTMKKSDITAFPYEILFHILDKLNIRELRILSNERKDSDIEEASRTGDILLVLLGGQWSIYGRRDDNIFVNNENIREGSLLYNSLNGKEIEEAESDQLILEKIMYHLDQNYPIKHDIKIKFVNKIEDFGAQPQSSNEQYNIILLYNRKDKEWSIYKKDELEFKCEKMIEKNTPLFKLLEGKKIETDGIVIPNLLEKAGLYLNTSLINRDNILNTRLICRHFKKVFEGWVEQDKEEVQEVKNIITKAQTLSPAFEYIHSVCAKTLSAEEYDIIINFLIKENSLDYWNKLNNKHKIINYRFPNGWTLIHWAAGLYNKKNTDNIITTILRCSKDLSRYVKKTKDSNQFYLPIHIACERGNLAMFSTLDEETGGHYIAKLTKNNNVLHIASTNGHLSIIKYIVRHSQIKYIINITNDIKRTPVYCACAGSGFDKNVKEIIKILYKNGATIERKLLYLACEKGRTETVKYLFKEIYVDRFGFDKIDKIFKTALQKACEYNQVGVIYYLLNTYFAYNNFFKLINAKKSNNKDILRLAEEHINIMSNKAKSKSLREFYVIINGCLSYSSSVQIYNIFKDIKNILREIMSGRHWISDDSLLAKADTIEKLISYIKDKNYTTNKKLIKQQPNNTNLPDKYKHILEICSDLSVEECQLIECLVLRKTSTKFWNNINNKQKNEILEHQFPNRWLLIHWLAKLCSDSDKIVDDIVNLSNLEIKKASQESPLHIACGAGNNKVFQLIVQKNANNSNYDCFNGVLHLACYAGHYSIVNAFWDKCYSKFIEQLNKKDNRGWTPIYYACTGKGSDKDIKDIVKLLVDKKASWDYKLIYLACKNKNNLVEAIKYLYTNYKQTGSTTKNKLLHEALPIACGHNQVKVVHFLLKKCFKQNSFFKKYINEDYEDYKYTIDAISNKDKLGHLSKFYKLLELCYSNCKSRGCKIATILGYIMKKLKDIRLHEGAEATKNKINAIEETIDNLNTEESNSHNLSRI